MISGDLFQILLDIFGKQDAKHVHIIAYADSDVNALSRNSWDALLNPLRAPLRPRARGDLKRRGGDSGDLDIWGIFYYCICI